MTDPTTPDRAPREAQSFTAVCKRWALNAVLAGRLATEEHIRDGCDIDAAALRALAAICDRAERLWKHEASLDDPTREIADLLHALAAGFDPEGTP